MSRPKYSDVILQLDLINKSLLELQSYISQLDGYCDELEVRDKPMKMIVDESPLFNGFPNAHYECPKCHKSLWGDENYCGHCGQKLRE